MASIIRVICFRGRAVKCGLRVFSIAMISFMVSLGVNAVLEAVFYLLWPFFFLRYLKITHADWRRYCIDERPAIVAEKTRIGDWEIDTVIGQNHQGALVTIVDRVSKFTLIKRVDSKHAEVVTAATIILLQPYIDKTLTITADNGKEFAEHETMKEQLNADVYFAHPYHSWERGLNENTNGLIRQYFTKGSSFENITDDEVAAVMNKLNHRPRKTLNFKTPHTVFFAEPLQDAA